ncbi:MAG: cysteine desulfurase family protein [Candidatus Nomurabacteria bacterium]|nr:cysteine desulfurase family protein [Candidatus Nomurabacteria bacterium]
MPKSNGRSIKKTRKIYLDYASSALSQTANPGAIHELGVKEKNKLESARATVAKILNAQNAEIIFTSGATESNNLAILGLVYAGQEQGFLRSSVLRVPSPARPFKNLALVPHIVTTNIEHASVLETCKHLEKMKQAEVTYVPVEENGIVDVKKIKKALKLNTVLVSVMYANNEIGTIQPIREIAKEIRHWRKTHLTRFQHPLLGKERVGVRFPFFHTDATQAVNYLPISVPQLGVDLMSMNSAKIYGPKGIGALYVKKNTPIGKIMFGGDQEFGLRPGTENVALAVEFAKTLQTVEKIKEQEVKRLAKLRDYFFEKILENTKNFAIAESLVNFEIILNGDQKNRLPNNVNITIPNIPSDLLVIELSAKGIMASAKSACKSGDGKASHVIEAIRHGAKPARNASGIADARPHDSQQRVGQAGGEEDGSLRFSLGRETTKSDIDYTVKALSEILAKLKKWYD